MYTLGVSHSNRWMVCQAAPRLALLSPPIEKDLNPQREVGLDAHHVAELVIPSNGERAPREFVGQVLPHGTLFTIDHAIAVGVYVKDVLDIAQHCSEPVLVEDRNDLSWLGPGVVAIVDAAAYDKTSRHLTVWDLKFGHSPRDPYYDWQMIGNGLAMAYKYPEAQRIDLRIVQPNVYGDEPIKTWSLDVDELKKFGERMRFAAQSVQTGNAPAIAGTHCRGCRAAHTCPALKQFNERYSAALEESLRTQPKMQTPQEISLELDLISTLSVTLKARKEAQDAYAYQLADRQAVNVPGFKLVSKRTQRRINDPSAFVEAARVFGYSDTLLHHPAKLLSPAQLENVGVNKELVEMFTEKPDGGKQLAPMSDNRPAQAAELLERFKSVIK